MTARRSLLLTVLAYPGALSAQNIAEVQVAPPSVTIKVGERSGLLATASDRAGNVIPPARIIWSSNTVAVARVDNNGTVTGVAGGVAIVEARAGTRKGQAAVQVVGAAPAPTGGAASPPAGGQTPAPPSGDAFAGQSVGSRPAAGPRGQPPPIYPPPPPNTRRVPPAPPG